MKSFTEQLERAAAFVTRFHVEVIATQKTGDVSGAAADMDALSAVIAAGQEIPAYEAGRDRANNQIGDMSRQIKELQERNKRLEAEAHDLKLQLDNATRAVQRQAGYIDRVHEDDFVRDNPPPSASDGRHHRPGPANAYSPEVYRERGLTDAAEVRRRWMP